MIRTSARASRLAKMPRQDSQKLKVYRAEWETLRNDTVGTTTAEVQAYVDRVTDLAWFRRRWGSHKITVRGARGQGGLGGGSSIKVGLNVTGARGTQPGAQKAVVLHEIAHCLAPVAEHHGPEFVRILLELVRFECSPEEYEAYREALKKNRVKVGPPTPLMAAVKTPAPRPVKRTYRVQIDKVPVLFVEATSLAGALYTIQSRPGLNQLLRDAVDIRIWKSRAPAQKLAASWPQRTNRKDAR